MSLGQTKIRRPRHPTGKSVWQSSAPGRVIIQVVYHLSVGNEAGMRGASRGGRGGGGAEGK